AYRVQGQNLARFTREMQQIKEIPEKPPLELVLDKAKKAFAYKIDHIKNDMRK
ncbi:hypothetical protein LCGC14_3014400, partial [marine sediment metagenome]